MLRERSPTPEPFPVDDGPGAARARHRYNRGMISPTRCSRGLTGVVAVASLIAGSLVAGPARACPFCSAVSLTFAQEIAQSQAAVIARLVEPPPASALGPTAEGPLPKGKFTVVEVLKGADLV
ncbi:MAG: hypothetical protein RLZZ440_901, partial [Planctomycetota bacterium]